ncbi:exodeoxyribonuclease III [Christensenellaceae bacterium OttesenSCG-928-K19]|nr:exodeoxyribonuclease III [Christensenellaceae bacterium OttesenSCG-928-K19]
MKLISWNVNGMRAVLKKGFDDFFAQEAADVFCLQETKMQEGQAEVLTPGYTQYWNSADKKGYSGTAIFSKATPLSVDYDFGGVEHRTEGRVITLEYEEYYLVNAYTPNAQPELARIDYRMRWQDEFCAYLGELKQKKPVVICGDLNVARTPMDLKNPKPNEGKAGFSPQEREKMEELLATGFTDTFRMLYPDKVAYTWWSYRFNARANNAGWRIDYFLVSENIKNKVGDSLIYSDVMGSDHCPIGLMLNL